MNATTCPRCGIPSRDARRRYCSASHREADRRDAPERLADVLRVRVAHLSDVLERFEREGYASAARLRQDRDRLAAELADLTTPADSGQGTLTEEGNTDE